MILPILLTDLSISEKLSPLDLKFFKFVGEKFYWDKLLKRNNAFAKRFARPYEK